MSMKQHFKTMLADTHDPESVSSKRVVTLVAFLLCCIAFFANLFFGYKMDAFIYETMAYIVLGGFGITGLEKFAKKGNEPPAYYPPQNYDHEPTHRSNRWE